MSSPETGSLSSRLGVWENAPDGPGMRRAMGRWLTGVAVVTTIDEAGEYHGGTISSLQSISLEPPILMLALNFNTRTGEALRESGRFGISILGGKQEAIARRFAVRGGERFEGGEFEDTPQGIPVVHGALTQAECTLFEHHVIGDHDVYFGQVTASRHRSGSPLAFLGGRFGDFRDFGHEEMPWSF